MSAKVKRREFMALLGGAAAWPLAVGAQQGERMRRIGEKAKQSLVHRYIGTGN